MKNINDSIPHRNLPKPDWDEIKRHKRAQFRKKAPCNKSMPRAPQNKGGGA